MTYFRKVSQIQHLIIERAELLCCTGYSFSEDIIIPCNSFEMKILCIYLILMPSRIYFQTKDNSNYKIKNMVKNKNMKN